MTTEAAEPSPKVSLAHALGDALHDAGVLLQFLGRADDGRLQAQFEDTRPKLAAVPARKTSPPVDSYQDFLNRLCEIATKRFRDEDISGVPPVVDGKPALSEVAFVIWARDFLAGVAAPATADTIQLTEAYRERRSDTFFHRLITFRWKNIKAWWQKDPGDGAGDELAKSREKIAGSARKLAGRVGVLNLSALVMTIVTVLLSVYALSGNLILAARDDAISRLKGIEDKIQDMEMHPDGRVPVNRLFVGTQDRVFLCDNFDVVGQDFHDPYKVSPSFGPIPNGVYSIYGSVDQIEVCQQRRRTLIQLFAIGQQLLSWQRVVTGRRSVHVLISAPLMETISGQVFGKSMKVIEEFSNNKFICQAFTGNRNPSGSADPIDFTGQIPWVHTQCKLALAEIAEYYGKIPDAILGCISLYILPCFYGFLGAAAATMRYLRMRADSYLMNFTDYGTILQNLILGVLAGAVIGLFAAYLLKTGPLQGIGVSGLAFLAGYNVSGLFAFFDAVSNRLFVGGASAAK